MIYFHTMDAPTIIGIGVLSGLLLAKCLKKNELSRLYKLKRLRGEGALNQLDSERDVIDACMKRGMFCYVSMEDYYNDLEEFDKHIRPLENYKNLTIQEREAIDALNRDIDEKYINL